MATLFLFVIIQVVVEETLFFKLLASREDRVSFPAIWYQQILTSTSRPTKPRFTTVVQVGGDLPKSGDDVCAYRGYIASLIDGVAAYQPRAIMLDMAFEGKIKCTENTVLIESIQNACAHMPVVVGVLETQQARKSFQVSRSRVEPSARTGS